MSWVKTHTHQESVAKTGIGLLDTGISLKARPLRKVLGAYVRVDRQGRLVPDAIPEDANGHGTHLAGILTEECPGAELYVGQVIDGGKAVARILAGMNWLLKQPVGVACLSLGLKEKSPVFFPMLELFRKRDILAAVSIGNGGAGRSFTPGWYPNVLSVGSVSGQGRVSSFSGSFNPRGLPLCQKPDLLAVGENVWSFSRDGGRKKQGGTSMANARLAGMAARLRSEFPDAKTGEITAALKRSAKPAADDKRHKYVYGIADLEGARKLLEQGGETEAPYPSNDILRKFRDKRLQYRIRTSRDDALIEAVLVLYPEVEAKAYLQTEGTVLQASYPAANTYVLSVPRQVLAQWTEDRKVWMLNAVDIPSIFSSKEPFNN